MTKREIFVVASKILGIYLLVRAVDLFAQNFPFFLPILTKGFEGTWYLLGALVTFALYIGGAFYLIKWAERIATRLSGEEEAPEAKAVVEKDSLQQIAFSAVGVFIIATALPRLPQIITYLSLQDKQGPEVVWRTWGTVTGLVLQLGIGAFLFLGSRALVGLIKKLKAI